ncbi:MAG: HWE histidine kinase domain-containing protein [Rhodomicrobium sp.]
MSQLQVGAQKLFTVILRDISERKRHEEHTQLLLREINHRSKNMLAVVQAIARQTLSAKPEDFIGRFGERIQALSASQDLLVANEWKGVDIAELVQSQLAHFQDLIGTRIELRGLSFLISPSAAQTIGMALHELTTNAGKYGALSNSDGRLEVGWNLERPGDAQAAFVMFWNEQSGPPVTPPDRRGFGSTVIQNVVAESLDAEVDLEFGVSGLSWRLRCPAKEVIEERPSPPATHDRFGSRAGSFWPIRRSPH